MSLWATSRARRVRTRCDERLTDGVAAYNGAAIGGRRGDESGGSRSALCRQSTRCAAKACCCCWPHHHRSSSSSIMAHGRSGGPAALITTTLLAQTQTQAGVGAASLAATARGIPGSVLRDGGRGVHPWCELSTTALCPPWPQVLVAGVPL